VERLLVSGRIALHYEDYVLSIQYFNQAIAQKPYLWEPWQLRSIAKYYLEDWQGAEADASQAILLNPYVTNLYDLRGITRIRQQHYDDAIADYTKAIKLEPNNQNYWYNRTVCYIEKGDYDYAQLQLDTIIGKWKRFASPYLMKAEAYLHQKDTTQAMAWLDKSLTIDAYNIEAWRMRGYVALSQERWSTADSSFTKAIHLKPKNVPCLINRALARLRLNNLRGAMSDYDVALSADPNNFLAHYNRGLLRQQVGDDNRAIEDFDYVLALEPNNVLALFNRATLLDQTGDLKGAIRDYTKVLQHFPNFWTGLRYRANCYRRLGMNAQAEQDEFRILKAQMDKRLGIQQRWSRRKLAEMRKLSDVDPNKYDQLVVEDEVNNDHDYKSEYRGKVQNRQVTEHYQPYIALTMSAKRSELSSYTPFDRKADSFIERLRSLLRGKKNYLPKLGGVGESSGIETGALIDSINININRCKNEADVITLTMLRAVALSSAQNYNDALKDIESVLASHPNNNLVLWQKTVCLAMQAEHEKGLTPQQKALRYAGVMSDFDKLSKLDSDNAFILYNQGTYAARNNDNQRAIDALTKAIEIDSRMPQAYYNRGLAYLHSGMIKQAKADLSKAGELGIYSAYSLLKMDKKIKQNSK
jgi:tetratricopeptide (TPR) repeat protein